jgi:RHS repeat-associated protein
MCGRRRHNSDLNAPVPGQLQDRPLISKLAARGHREANPQSDKSTHHLMIKLAVLLCLSLMLFDVMAQPGGSQIRRCRTADEIDGSYWDPFVSCPAITGTNEASVSDETFTTILEFNGTGADYIERWTAQGFAPVERVYAWNGAQWKGPCGTGYGDCYYSPLEWMTREYWDIIRGTLSTENIGTWLYEELWSGDVIQSLTFEVRELNLSARSGANQIGIVDQNLSRSLVLQLQSFEDIGIEDETIEWSISGPKGAKNAAVTGLNQATDQDGITQATIHLGTKPGVYELTLNNRWMITQPRYYFEAIADIEDTNPEARHPDVEEGVGENPEQCDIAGNPIALSIGNKFQKETDIERAGISPIEFVRYHNSLGYVSGSFNNYWTHSYDRSIEIPVDTHFDPVKVIRPDGKMINFTWNGSAYQPFPGVHSELEETATGWRFTDEGMTVESYDSDGLLIDISELSGVRQFTTHNRNDKLIRVESNTGESLDFTYDAVGRLSSVTDQAGRVWSYRYEVLGRLQYVDNADGTTREYHYEDLRHAYALTGITTENGQRYSWYEYDEEGLAIASYHANNVNRIDIQYKAGGERVVLDPLGNATVYQSRIENKRGVLEGISGPICSQGCGLSDTDYSYDSDLNITSKTVFGVTTQFGNHDAKGQAGYRIRAVGTPEEKRAEYEYDSRFTNRITHIIESSIYDGEFKETSRSYDASGNMLSETVTGFDAFGQAVSRTIGNTFNGPFAQITSSDGPRSDVSDITRYEYYANDSSEGPNRARLKAIIDPNGIRIRDNIVYSPVGKIFSETRPNGSTIDYEYYAGNGRVKSITELGGGLFKRTTWQYLPVGDVERIILDDETGQEIITQFSYDSARRLNRTESRVTRTQSGQNDFYTADQWQTYEFDDAGNIISETHESRDVPQNDLIIDKVFDAYSRIDRITQGGISEDYDYNPDGTLASITDGNLNTTAYTYDAFKRLTNTDQVGQISHSMSYDVQGNTQSVTDQENHSTRYHYDDLGNLQQQDSPDTGLTSHFYNESGQLISTIDAKSQISLYSYDRAGRLTDVDHSGSDDDLTYSYDICANGTGRLCSITTGWGHVIHYEWNALGETTAVTSNEGQVKYTFGPQSILTSIEYPSGRIIRYEIDGGGLPAGITLSLSGLPETMLLDQIKYSPLRRPVSWRFANGQRTTVDLDARHRPVSIDTPGVWNWQASLYDANDNILDLNTSLESYSYGYDSQGRLISADTASTSTGFTYDKVGNRLSRLRDSVNEPGSYEAGSNRISAFGDRQYTHDPNGNITTVTVNQLPGNTHVYSSHNRLTGIIDDQTSASLATYRYDALGQRVTKSTPTETRKFIYGLSGELLAEIDGNGKILHEYVYLNGMPVVDMFEAVNGVAAGAAAEIIFDNDGALVAGKNWQTKTDSAAVNGSFIQNRKRNDRAVYWYVDETDFQGGLYDVYVKWLVKPGNGSQTSYQIDVWNDSGGSDKFTVNVDHAGLNKGDWVFLGNYEFDDKHSTRYQKVSLVGPYNDTGLLGTYLIADAVKLVPTNDPLDSVDLRFFHNDHLGTPRVLTDGTGQIIWAATFLPFGEAAVDEDPDGDGIDYSMNIRFPGQYDDAESGLHYNYFRTYDPAIGRYIESDPIGLKGGVNTFAYANNNPLLNSDPSGLAYFAFRPLQIFNGPRHCASGTISDRHNLQPSHEQLFFEDGKQPGNLGFFSDSLVRPDNPANLSLYACQSKKYNDCAMRKAVSITQRGSYCLLGIGGVKNNCQDWADRVKANYRTLLQDPTVLQQCFDCEN